MVLMIFLALFSFNLWSQNSVNVEAELKQATKLTAAKRFNDSQQLLKKFIDDKKLEPKFEVSDALLEKTIGLMAINAENYESYAEAILYYNHLIKKFYVEINKNILLALKNDDFTSISEVPNKLKFYYFKKAQLAQKIYFKTNKQDWKKTSINYAKICQEVDFKYNESEAIINQFESHDRLLNNLIFKNYWSASMSFLSWQDQLLLTGPVYNTTLIATSRATCYGGSISHANYFRGYKLDSCLLLGYANVGENSRSVDYFQGDVNLFGFVINPGLFWNLFESSGAFGFNLPVFYRSGNYTVPENNDVTKKALLTYGMGIEAKWKIDSLYFSQKISKFKDFKSITWQFELGYNFD